MPVLEGRNFYQFGLNGHKYYFIPGDKKSKLKALNGCKLQGRAIAWSKHSKSKSQK